MNSNQIPHVPSSASLRIAGLVVAIIAIGIAVAGILVRVSHANDLQKDVDSQYVTVKVVNPLLGPSEQELILPGNVRADLDAPIYARVTGYLKAWHTDIGTHVKKGQILAEVETPELDQQILRAKADLATAESKLSLIHI